MYLKFSAIISILGLISSVQSFAVPSVPIKGDGFVALKPRLDCKSDQFHELYYWISVSETVWDTAVQICGDSFGGADLVEFETDEERDFVDCLLDGYGAVGERIWIGGESDSTATNNFRWYATRKPFNDWTSSKWAPGMPPPFSNPEFRVLHHHISRYQSEWDVVFKNQVHKYICEIPREEIPLPCYSDIDIVIILDSSRSVGEPNFLLAKAFAARLTKAFTDSLGNRLAFMIYSDAATLIYDLTIPVSPNDLDAAINSTPYIEGGTNTHLALSATVDMYNRRERTVPMSMVIVTDGESTGPPGETLRWADAVKALGVRMISVGVGSGTNAAELLALAGGNPDHVFTTQQYDKLEQTLRGVSIKACNDQ